MPDHTPWAPFPYAVHTNPATAHPNPQPIKIKPIIPAPMAMFFETLPDILNVKQEEKLEKVKLKRVQSSFGT